MYTMFSINEKPAPIAAPYIAASIKKAHLRILIRMTIPIPLMPSSMIGAANRLSDHKHIIVKQKKEKKNKKHPPKNEEISMEVLTREKLSNHTKKKKKMIG